MAQTDLPTEIRALIQRFVKDGLELVELMDAARLPIEEYAVDPAHPLEQNLNNLFAAILDRSTHQRWLAKEILRRYENARLPWHLHLEVRWGRSAILGIRTLTSLVLIIACLTVVYFIHLFLLNKEMVTLKGVKKGDLRQVNNNYVVLLNSPEDAIDLRSEVVLLPPRRNGLRRFDLCHLAVLLDKKPVELDSGENGYKVLDMYLDGAVCTASIEDFLVRGWGISIDVSDYPSTYVRRAEQAHREAERDGTTRSFKTRSLSIARSNLQIAIEIYQENPLFREQDPQRVERRMSSLRSKISYQDLLINAVTSQPKHEMVKIKGGRAWTQGDRADRKTFELPTFWIDRFEVSNFQYRQLNPTHMAHEGENDRPVTDVSWSQAKRYCQQRSLRLPTEDEFKKAAVWDWRRSEPRRFPWCIKDCENEAMPLDELHPVQEDPRGGSPYGVLHLVGNVAEWTLRKHSETFVVKGGSFASKSLQEFDIDFASVLEDTTRNDVGFRCAADHRPSSEDILIRE